LSDILGSTFSAHGQPIPVGIHFHCIHLETGSFIFDCSAQLLSDISQAADYLYAVFKAKLDVPANVPTSPMPAPKSFSPSLVEEYEHLATILSHAYLTPSKNLYLWFKFLEINGCLPSDGPLEGNGISGSDASPT
jgi:hypothetical protein